MSDLLALCRQSMQALYAAHPAVTLAIPTARRMFNEEAGELQEAATQLRLAKDLKEELFPGSRTPRVYLDNVALEAADVLYTLVGLLEACHITPEELDAATVAVCQANDRKREPDYSARDGKIRKVTT